MRPIPIGILLVLSNPCAVLAQAPTAITLRQADLSKHPFEIGQLKLTVDRVHKGYGRYYIQVKVENPSDGAVTFDPNLLSMVNSDSEQVDVTGFHGEAVPITKFLPAAVIRKGYWLARKVKFPARLYYDGKELAVITE